MAKERTNRTQKSHRKSKNVAYRREARRTNKNRRKRGNWFSRLSVGKKIAVILGVFFVCLIATAVIYVAAKLQKLDTKDIPKEDIIMNDLAEGVGEGYTNIALFGGDSRTGGLDRGVRTDSIIIASLNNKTREVRMVSVYRDTLLNLSDGTYEKCNAAYSYGGPKQAIDMLNMNLDLEIEDYVTVDFAAISDVIDLLGGIEIEVSEVEIPYLNKFLGETAMVAGKKAVKVTKPGLQKLDGVQATTYARIRSTKGGDFRRAERQRYVIEKMVEKALKSDLATINKIIDAVLPKIRTSLSAGEIFNYAKSFNKYKLGDNVGFPIEKMTDTIPGKGSVVIPTTLESNVVQLHAFLYGDEAYEPTSKVSSISRKIINITGISSGNIVDSWQRPSDMKPNSGTETGDAANEHTSKMEFTE